MKLGNIKKGFQLELGKEGFSLRNDKKGINFRISRDTFYFKTGSMILLFLAPRWLRLSKGGN